MARFTIHKSQNVAAVEALDQHCFPCDDPYPTAGATWWLAKNESGETVGFAGAKYWKPDNAVFLCRAGVHESARGHGLQKRMIAARIKWARSTGARLVYTYTLPNNCASSNSLIKAGFVTFEPSYQWGGPGSVYWMKKL
jgi:L-2,4-diaminobutyric acid acetyltransferase